MTLADDNDHVVDEPVSPRAASAEPGNTALVVLRVWMEEHETELRGRLLEPHLGGSASGAGKNQLAALVERALASVTEEIRSRRDGDATRG